MLWTPEKTSYSRDQAGEIRDELLRCLDAPGSKVEVDYPLAKRTTLRVGGPADLLVEPDSIEDLAATLRVASGRGIPILLLGRGSNLLVRAGGFHGVVIHLGRPFFRILEFDGMRATAGAGVRLKTLAMEAKRARVGGLEFLEGIPGSVGGALRMNAGAMGAEIFDRVISVEGVGLDGTRHFWTRRQLPHVYRECAAFREVVAVRAVLEGYPDTEENISQRLTDSNRKRWDTQPAKPSAGCTFKNPETIPAGRLIDELDLKKLSIGGAQVSETHGNFLVNNGAASSEDFLALIDLIKKRALESRGIELKTEVQIVGDDN